MKKHIVCFGDSNTHGYCADPQDCADHSTRFNEEERFPCRLQKQLGDNYLVLEEGLSGRTTVFEDPTYEGLSGLSAIFPVLMTHEPVDLLIIMLGTNDSKERFSASPYVVARGLDRLIQKAKSVPCWSGGVPNILVVSPPAIGEGLVDHEVVKEMGVSSIDVSRGLAEEYRAFAELEGCHFMDAEGLAEFNKVDCMHLTAKGHAQLADALTAKIREIFRDQD